MLETLRALTKYSRIRLTPRMAEFRVTHCLPEFLIAIAILNILMLLFFRAMVGYSCSFTGRWPMGFKTRLSLARLSWESEKRPRKRMRVFLR
jgi:hypothetical protein